MHGVSATILQLSYTDVIFAVVGAGVIFIIIKFISGGVRMFITRSSIIHYTPDQLDNLLESCYNTFPIDNLNFNGATFHRGTSVRVTTVRKTIIEGQFIGVNQAEMLCLVTDSTIVAQDLDAIQEIQNL